MTPHGRLMQRAIDGETNTAEAESLRQLVAGKNLDANQLQRHETLDALLREALPPSPVAERQALMARIVERLPTSAPAREHRVRLVDVLAATAIASLIGVGYGIAGTLRELLPLTEVTFGSIALGFLLLVGTTLLQRHPPLRRLLRWRISFGTTEALTYHLAGVTMIIGGYWLST